MKTEIQKMIDGFKAEGWKSHPYDLCCRLFDQGSDEVFLLVEMALNQLSKSGTFFDDAISFVREEKLPILAALAIETLRKGGEQEAAEAFIAHCSLQQPEALHPFLGEIYELKPNWDTYYSNWPWRKSDLLHFEFLKRVAEEASGSESEDAWKILLETRHSRVLNYYAERFALVSAPRVGEEFLEVGFELRGGKFHQLYHDTVMHCIFPGDYGNSKNTPNHLVKRHPTWRGAEASLSTPHTFGGVGSHNCSACGELGHNLISLLQIPEQLPITSLQTVRFETCLSCLGWEVPRMFYQHTPNGSIAPIGYTGSRIVPKFPAEPFKETQMHLAVTPRRWRWQDWAVTNSRQNLNRFGGHPCWVQNSDYLQCPLCSETMSFLFQLDSDMPAGFLWGSGGICYVQWCDRCKVSGLFWQCT
jgi:hypothetical protein